MYPVKAYKNLLQDRITLSCADYLPSHSLIKSKPYNWQHRLKSFPFMKPQQQSSDFSQKNNAS